MADNKNKSILSIDDSLEVNEESLGARMKPGIHEDVELVSIEYTTPEEENSKWSEALDFTFKTTRTTLDKDEQGNPIVANGKQVILSNPGETIRGRQFYDSSDAEKTKNMLKRVKHIMTKFLPPDEARVPAMENFKDLSSEVIKKLKGKTEGVKLRLKVVKNRAGYGNIPDYTPFVQLMGTTENKLRITQREKEGEKPTAIADLEAGMQGDSEIQLPPI